MSCINRTIIPKAFFAAALLCMGAAAFAQGNSGREISEKSDTTYRKPMTTSQAEMILPRVALQPVRSFHRSPSEPIDTIQTDNPFIRVILYGDNTWEYIKDPSYVVERELFTEYWSETEVNPYKMPIDSLPESWTMWMVDDMTQYYCPYQGEVNPRGKFGMRRGRRHQGVDLPLQTGTPIYAPFDGMVRISSYVGAYGNLVVIRHLNGLETFYGHLSERKVKPGDWVNAGDVIGLGGSTGRSTGPHLHFETRYKGYAFDPQWLINFPTGDLRHRLFLLKRRYFNPYSSYEQDFEDEFKNDEEDKAEEAEKAAMKYVTVKSGDTLSKIAANNGTTVNEICRLNGISKTTVLKIGRKLRVR